MSEDGFEVMRINCGVASIPPFRIDIPLFSENIQFGARQLREVLRLLHLPLGQHLGSRKVLKVFVIHNNINGIDQTF